MATIYSECDFYLEIVNYLEMVNYLKNTFFILKAAIRFTLYPIDSRVTTEFHRPLLLSGAQA
ncbi:hypothetical protein OI450_12405 [Pectobacterium cacticida]|uniref:Uncharacterized protein n=1 Tax=Pectobacterium cacticida TaxID=69221 RepID=A0ABZ2GDU5_9GAMM|nr:hypothetical protein [Pectobacterium cacticida]UYX05760.1 hypothetical protein OI450_12405 [Pectobacterium cacticida]